MQVKLNKLDRINISLAWSILYNILDSLLSVCTKHPIVSKTYMNLKTPHALTIQTQQNHNLSKFCILTIEFVERKNKINISKENLKYLSKEFNIVHLCLCSCSGICYLKIIIIFLSNCHCKQKHERNWNICSTHVSMLCKWKYNVAFKIEIVESSSPFFLNIPYIILLKSQWPL